MPVNVWVPLVLLLASASGSGPVAFYVPSPASGTLSSNTSGPYRDVAGWPLPF